MMGLFKEKTISREVLFEGKIIDLHIEEGSIT